MISVEFQVLDVGQGSANFVLVKRDGVIVTTFLIDIGTERTKYPGAGASVKHIADTLKKMTEPHIAALVLSHKDKDHVVLLSSLLDRFKPHIGAESGDSRPVLIIDSIFYGGSRKDYAKKIIDKALGYCVPSSSSHIGAFSFPFNHSQFRLPEPGKDFAPVPGHFWPCPHEVKQVNLANNMEEEIERIPTPRGGSLGITLSILGVNAYTPPKTKPDVTLDDLAKTGMDANAGSLVVALMTRQPNEPLTEAQVAIIVTGDATGVTFERFNNRIHSPYFNKVFHVTAPHHGSFRTGLSEEALQEQHAKFRVKKKKQEIEDPAAVKVLTEFVDRVQPQTVSASSALKTIWGHPSITVLAILARYTSRESVLYEDPRLTDIYDGNHFITAWMEQDTVARPSSLIRKFPSKRAYVSLQTRNPVFTTLYIPATQPDLQLSTNVTYQFDREYKKNTVLFWDGDPKVIGPSSRSWIFTIILDDGTYRIASLDLGVPPDEPMGDLKFRDGHPPTRIAPPPAVHVRDGRAAHNDAAAWVKVIG